MSNTTKPEVGSTSGMRGPVSRRFSLQAPSRTKRKSMAVVDVTPRQRFSLAIASVRASIRFQFGPRRPRRDPPAVKYENSYQMGPEDANRFMPKKAEAVMTSLLEEFLNSYDYRSASAGNFSKFLADSILDRVKRLGFKRYKLVANVILGADSGQDVEVCSRGLVDENRDNYASVKYQGKGFFAVATVHAIYFE